MFKSSSKACAYVNHLIGKRVKLIKKRWCRACKSEIKKELGDLLLHIVFYAKIGSETNDFDIADVANSICDKLIDRHPHIYGDVVVENEEQVKQNWEKLKLKEGRTSVL